MVRRHLDSSGTPVIPGRNRRHTQGRGIGAERPKKASPETLNGLGKRVLDLVGIREVPGRDAAPVRLGRILEDGQAVLLIVQNQEPEFAIQTADTINDTTTLHEWSKNAGIQRVTETHNGSIRARLAPEDIWDMNAILKAWETEVQPSGEA